MSFRERSSWLVGGIVILVLIGIVLAPQVLSQAGLFGFWQAEGNANDSSGNGNNGTLANGATFAAGCVGQAFSLDGVDDYVDLPRSLFNGLAAATMAAWINPDVIGPENFIFSGIKTGISHHITLRITSGNIQFATRDTSGDTRELNGSTIPTGTWTHVAGVFQSGASGFQKVYVNGVEDANLTFNDTNPLRPNVGTLRIGAQTTLNQSFDGLIDEVRAYNFALSAAEIQAIFNAEKCLVTVEIDIKPGSDPNSINLKSRGTTPVAILSTATFDATTEVDKSSLTFGKTGNEQSLVKCTRSNEDVNGDGRDDVVCHFNTEDTGFDENSVEGIIKGQLNNGTPLEGSDSVRITPGSRKGRGNSVAPLQVNNVLATPNPVSEGTAAVEFMAQGTEIEAINVEVFNLAGERIFDSGFTTGNTLRWNLLTSEGQAVANGVYLYVVTIHGTNGEVVRSEVKKLMVLR